MRSTKRPLCGGAEANLSAKSKHKLREKREDLILEKALNFMENSDKSSDEDSIFGQYVATYAPLKIHM